MNRKFILNLNKYINSQEFLLNTCKFKSEFRIKFIGLIIEYLILHKDFWQINHYINFLFKNQKNYLLIGNYWKIKDKREYLINSISNKLLSKNKNKITAYINKTFYKEGFFLS